MGITGIQSRIL